MAWISVHETIKGPKLRELRKLLGCSEFEATGILIYLWLWGLDNATKDGLILAADDDDISRVIAYAGAGCKLDPNLVVQALFESGWLDRSPNGIYIHDWDTWQEQWYKVKENRERDALRKRESRKHKATEVSSATSEQRDNPAEGSEDSSSGEPAAEEPPAAPEEPAPKTPEYSKPFEQWWATYPRKIDKGYAYKKYQARRRDGYSDDELFLAAVNYADICKRQKTEKQFIKPPKTFLSESLPFLDYLPKDTMLHIATQETDAQNPFRAYMEDDE